MLAAKRCSRDRAFPNTPSSVLPAASGGVRRRCSKEIASRHLSSSPPSSSKTNSSSISTFSSPSSSPSSSPPLHSPSPFPNPLPTTPALSPIRSKSLDRAKTDWGSVAAARTVLRTTSRSFSVSFQGESFFYQTTKVKPAPEKSITVCRKPIVVGVENSQPNDQQTCQCPTARSRESNLVARRLDYDVDRVKPILMTVRLLLDETNLNASDRSQSPDSADGLSSASILSFPNSGTPAKPPAKPRGICVPARFRQENGLRRPDRVEIPQKRVSEKQRQLANTQLPPPRFGASPLYGPKSSSPIEDGVSRTRRIVTASHSSGQVGNAPSIISFASEVRRTKKGERRIEDAHMLRLLHNRYLQWRYINSLAENSSSTQLTSTKDTIYNAWITILELHDSAMNKQILLQLLLRNLKLASILKEQIGYLEEWSTLHEDHEISVKGAIEALEASTLRLPIIDGAKMDIQEIKVAVNSATGVTQAMAASMGSSLSKVEAISSLVSELSKAAAFERSLLNQSRELLSMVAALHVKHCSLRSCILQLEKGSSSSSRSSSLMHLQ